MDKVMNEKSKKPTAPDTNKASEYSYTADWWRESLSAYYNHDISSPIPYMLEVLILGKGVFHA